MVIDRFFFILFGSKFFFYFHGNCSVCWGVWAFDNTTPTGYCLRGPTPFEDMIFYLWTDSNEICTAYVKLKINHILFMKNF